jgi:hypothetical protein
LSLILFNWVFIWIYNLLRLGRFARFRKQKILFSKTPPPPPNFGKLIKNEKSLRYWQRHSGLTAAFLLKKKGFDVTLF